MESRALARVAESAWRTLIEHVEKKLQGVLLVFLLSVYILTPRTNLIWSSIMAAKKKAAKKKVAKKKAAAKKK